MDWHSTASLGGPKRNKSGTELLLVYLITMCHRSYSWSPNSLLKGLFKWRAKFWVTVIKGPFSHNLLGRSITTRMGLVMRDDGMYTVMLNDVFGNIGLLKCEPVKIELNTDCEPYSLTTPRCIPFPPLPKVEAELISMLDMGIIEEVTESSDWCAPMVPVEKKNSEQILLQTSAFRYFVSSGNFPETDVNVVKGSRWSCHGDGRHPRVWSNKRRTQPSPCSSAEDH